MKRIVLTGGGTAGHVVPNLAILPYLKGNEIHYIGSGGMEKALTENSGVIYHEIPCVKLVRKLSLSTCKVPFKLMDSVTRARKILREINPDVIFSKGGYVALPVVLAAKNRTPVILHESDCSPGLANRLSYPKCDRLLTAFDCIKKKKAEFVGAPIRRSLYCGSASAARAECGFKGDKKVLLAFGGSLGSKSICAALRDNAKSLKKRYDVVLVTGANSVNGPTGSDGWVEKRFINNIGDYFALADIVVSRGGANSLFELMALKKPTLCIPLPKGVSRGDQLENSAYFCKKGCIEMLSDGEYLSQNLLSAIESVENNQKSLCRNMQRLTCVDGTKRIARLILSAANGNAF
ncbi:MAG: UDP-N-acetylglucosamine--N-acetylmuramyl-(pentapeptide) pyrophosphoryl-undecaprenol N-acetylglucosamine transferase [Candidatus Neoclostridium sp.]